MEKKSQHNKTMTLHLHLQLISLNMGTEELLVNKWENKVTQIFFCKLKSSALLNLVLKKK